MEADKGKQLQGSDREGKWKNMDENMLLKIFMTLNIVDLVFRVSEVCQSWHKASQEPSLWRTIDMGKIMRALFEPCNHEFLNRNIMRNLESILTCSQGHVTSFICNNYMELPVSDWVFIAERTPRLKKFVMSLLESIKLSGFCEAVKRWPALESLAAASVVKPYRLLQAIAENCPAFSRLKHMGVFDMEFANAIITLVPKLKVLSLRGSLIHKEALDLIIENLEGLKILNISHCLLVHHSEPGGPWVYYPQLTERMRNKTSMLEKFIVCMEPCCPKCVYVLRQYKFGWFDYDEKFWKKDEVSWFIN